MRNKTLQTSDALGAAAAQLGPNVASLVVELHTELGMPLEKVVRVLRTQFGLPVTKGGLVRLLHRTAAAAAPAYAALREQVRRSPVVTPDETRWPPTQPRPALADHDDAVRPRTRRARSSRAAAQLRAQRRQ